jgi:hypothetical protein
MRSENKPCGWWRRDRADRKWKGKKMGKANNAMLNISTGFLVKTLKDAGKTFLSFPFTEIP